MRKIKTAVSGRAQAATTPLSAAAIDLMRSAVSNNSWRAYGVVLRQWITRCQNHGVAPFPADPGAVGNWLAELAAAGRAVSTMRTVVAALKFAHRVAMIDMLAKGTTKDAAKYQFDSQHPAIKLVMRGILRSNRRIVGQKEPLRSSAILKLLETCDESLIGLRDAAALATGYCMAARRSELAKLDYDRPGLGDGYLRLTASAIEVTMARSKTNVGCDTELVIIPRDENPEAVRAIERWVTAANILPGEPFLREVRRSGHLGPPIRRSGPNGRGVGGHLAPAAISGIVKRRIRLHLASLPETPSTPAIAAEVAKHSSHSLRSGLIVSATEAGAGLLETASVSRHATLAMLKRYTRRADREKMTPYRLAGVGLRQSKSRSK